MSINILQYALRSALHLCIGNTQFRSRQLPFNLGTTLFSFFTTSLSLDNVRKLDNHIQLPSSNLLIDGIQNSKLLDKPLGEHSGFDYDN